MKKKIILLGVIALIISGILISINLIKQAPIDIRSQHESYLSNSPFKETLKLSKTERKVQGIPPNKYFEREWELTMNPMLGRPTPENLNSIQKEIKKSKTNSLARVSGDKSDNSWIERGPNNVGGRVRAIMFDPNDNTNNTVFAAGVSGGLWKNTNISLSSSTWTRVNIDENLNITSMTYDPNNTSVFYAGTGESYVNGDVNGNGLWKSSNGGSTWTRIFGGATANGEAAKLRVNSPASIMGEYAAFQAGFGSPLTQITGELVLANDGTGSPTLACSTLVNNVAMNGKIAIIERGSCSFAIKVKNAEKAGAVAVIVVNNAAGPPTVMGGSDYTIYIPAIMISQADGQAIMAQLGSTVNVTIKPDPTPSTGSFSSRGIQHINDVVVRDIGSTSEIYVAASASRYTDANPTGFIGTGAYGLYKSIDNGVTWTLITLPVNGSNSAIAPNNIEIGSDNTIWVSTTRSIVSPADPGGQVLSSSDGITFTLKHTVANGRRTEIAVSNTNPNKIYVLAQVITPNPTPNMANIAPFIHLIRTDNNFVSTTSLALPNDTDTGIPSDDFTRGQSFYNLVINVNPINDANVFVGGIDLFSSINSGASWSQMSKWSNNNDLKDLNEPLVHADQHAIAFGNGDATKMIFGNDGGVYYSGDSGVNIGSRNSGFNVTQFYTVAVAPTVFSPNSFLAGAQDNGTQYWSNGNPTGPSGSTRITGGDGAFSFFDQVATDYLITNYVYNNSIYLFDFSANAYRTIASNDNDEGDFINSQDLDSNLDILYSNGTTGSTHQIFRYEGLTSLVADPADPAPPNQAARTVLTNVGFLDANITSLKVSPHTIGSTTLLVGLENGTLLKVTNADNGSISWSEFTVPFIGSISDIEFGSSEMEIFVTMHNYGVISIWYSNDGGTSWFNKEGNLPDMPVKCILQNPLNLEEVIVGTELGVWYTNDFSASSPNWSSAFSGMSNVKVTDLDLRNDNAIFAATYGRGVFSGQFTAPSLSTNVNELSSELKIYPTASNGEMTISSKSNLGKLTINVFNLNGKSVYNSKVDMNGSKAQLTLYGLSSGIYLVKFFKDNFSEVKKIVIK